MKAEAEKLFHQALSKLKQGDIAAAVDSLIDITEKFPDFGKANNYLGLIYFRYFLDAPSAESFFKKAISLAPDFSKSYVNYAALLLSHNRLAEMNANLNKVSEIPGVEKDKVFELFGKLNEIQGRLDDAIGFYKKAIALTFSDEDLLLYEKAIDRCNKKKKFL